MNRGMMFVRRHRTLGNLPRGQGLLEVMLAIGMILIGLGAVLTLTLQNIAASAASGQQLVGAQLAREVIEAARAVRDSNWLVAGNSDPTRVWDEGLTDNSPACGTTCNGSWVGFDVAPTQLPTPQPSTFTITFLPTRDVNDAAHAELQLYRHFSRYDWAQFSSPPPVASGYLPTSYRRLLALDPVCSDSGTITVAVGQQQCPAGTKVGVRAEAVVSWPASGLFGTSGRRSTRVVEYIYNWR